MSDTKTTSGITEERLKQIEDRIARGNWGRDEYDMAAALGRLRNMIAGTVAGDVFSPREIRQALEGQP